MDQDHPKAKTKFARSVTVEDAEAGNECSQLCNAEGTKSRAGDALAFQRGLRLHPWRQQPSSSSVWNRQPGSDNRISRGGYIVELRGQEDFDNAYEPKHSQVHVHHRGNMNPGEQVHYRAGPARRK